MFSVITFGPSPTTSSDPSNKLLILSALIAIGYFMVRRWLNNRPREEANNIVTAADALNSHNASLILTLYTMGVNVLKASEGTLSGYPYKLLLTSQTMSLLPEGAVRAPDDEVIMCVDLPKRLMQEGHLPNTVVRAHEAFRAKA